jgi:transposase
MRPVCVFAHGPGSEMDRLRSGLRGPWRPAVRAVMVLLSVQGLPAAQIAGLLECHPATVRRWIDRFNREGTAGLADRPRSGRPRLGGRRLARRVAALLWRPGPWTLPRIWRHLGRPQVSMRTLYRRVRQVALWRRPKLTARGDPGHDQAVAAITARLLELPRRAVVLAEDETHLNLLPHVRASWTLRGVRPQIPTPGKNRQVTVFGAIEVTAGAWAYRLGRRCAADFIAFLRMLAEAFPRAPVIVVICDNDSIHHARAVTRYLERHPPPGTAVRSPLQPARQPRRTHLGRAEELRRQHRRHMARLPPADPLLLPQPLTRPDAGYGRPLDQPLAATGLRTELLECRLVLGILSYQHLALAICQEFGDRHGQAAAHTDTGRPCSEAASKARPHDRFTTVVAQTRCTGERYKVGPRPLQPRCRLLGHRRHQPHTTTRSVASTGDQPTGQPPSRVGIV